MRGNLASAAAALLLSNAAASPVPQENIIGGLLSGLGDALLDGIEFVQALAPNPLPVFPDRITRNDIIITKENTLNATAPAPKDPDAENARIKARGNRNLPIGFYNNLEGTDGHVYIAGQDSQGRNVFVKADGTFYYPDYNHANPGVPQEVSQVVAMSLGDAAAITPGSLPDYINSGRIYFSRGYLRFATVRGGNGYASLVQPSIDNPTDKNIDTDYSFVEFTNNPTNLYWNLSFVDFVDVAVNGSLTGDRGLQSVKGIDGLQHQPVNYMCLVLYQQQQKDGWPWNSALCQHGRVVNPSHATSQFNGYFDPYVNRVYDFYTNNDLMVDTQAGPGIVKCRVSGGVLRCDGADRTFPKPSTADIFGCNSGPFANPANNNAVTRAVVPRLCAGFNRGTYLLFGGNTQPSPYLKPENYYTEDITNHYARITHEIEIDHKGYAFSYDDVVPAGVTVDGSLVDGNPTGLLMTIGGAAGDYLAARR